MELSIVIPTLNCGRYLEQTLCSLRGLLNKGVFVLICDGGSTDSTLAIAKAFGVPVVGCSKAGMYPAINFAIRASSTKWVTYVNGDDIIYADALMELFSHNNNADIMYGSVDFIDGQSRFLHSWISASPRCVSRLFSEIMPFPQLGTIFKRSVFDDLGGFDEKYLYAADLDFFLKACRRGYVYGGSSRAVVGAFRLHSGQLSQVRSKQMNDEIVSIRKGERRSIYTKINLNFHRINNWRSYFYRIARNKDLGLGMRIGRTIA